MVCEWGPQRQVVGCIPKLVAEREPLRLRLVALEAAFISKVFQNQQVGVNGDALDGKEAGAMKGVSVSEMTKANVNSLTKAKILTPERYSLTQPTQLSNATYKWMG